MEELVYDRVTPDGMCEVKVVSDAAIAEARMMRFFSGPDREHAKVHCYATTALSLFHGEIRFPLRGALALTCEGWRKPRHFAAWRLMKEDGLRVSQVIEKLAEWYFVQTHWRGGFAFMKVLPAGVESGKWEVDGVQLFEAEWAPEKCVLVGG